MKKIFLIISSLLCLGSAVHAQTAAAYTFVSLPSPFASIAATGTAVPTLSADNVTETGIPIGFTFTYCGTAYTTLSACSNGWISLTGSSSTAPGNSSAAIAGAGWLMPFWDDLDGSGGTAYYETQGTAPNRIFVFEWHDWHSVSGSGTGSFQIKLYETFNLIDFHYGPTTLSGTSATIGISNDNISDWQTTADGSTSPTVLASPAFTTSVSSPAPDGWLYRWTPSSCPVAPITGPTSICTGGSTLVFSATAGCTWSSSNPAVAFIAAGTGAVLGLTVGTTVLSYISPLGCYATKVFTVTPVPPITGTLSLCTGVPETYTHPTPGGTWTSSNVTVATVGSSTGIVTGVAAGTAKITYILPGGCKSTAYITVNTSPADVTGTLVLCQGSSTTLTSGPAGGTWSSSSGGIASVDAAGNVSGISGGTANISYTLASGCFRAAEMTINPLPAAITGGTSLCILGTMPLSSATPGGTWASSAPAIATVDASGLVTAGPTAGTSVITYTLPTGCYVTTTVSVVVVVSPIVGPTVVCMNENHTYTNATGVGTWSSSNTAVGTIDAAGLFVPLSAGTTTISYTLGSGCFTATTVTVNPNDFIFGVATVCQGQTMTMTNSVAGGTWSSADAAIFTVGSSTGVVTGIAGGTALISYTNPYGCITSTGITVHPTPAAITGDLLICIGDNTPLSSSPAGGTWASGNTTVAGIDAGTGAASGLTAGTAGITYASIPGCVITAVLTVSPIPAPIGGAMTVCPGYTTALTHPVSGGTWTSSNAAIATIGASSGILTGVNVSGGTATITYAPPASGCITTRVATVSPAPAISGAAAVCVGANTTLSTSMGGSTWTSSNTAVATIGSSSGVVSGVSGGTATITCFGGNGCTSRVVVTVNTNPAAITGTATVCVGSNTTLSNATPGGVWSSSNTSTATITAGGMVTGVNASTVTISYTVGTGCFRTVTVTVNPLPATITGSAAICSGLSTTFSSSGGGTWSSGNATVAPIDGASGFATGGAAGTSVISYTLPTGCFRTRVLTVNPLPAAIGGPTTVCLATTVSLTSTTSGGTWSSSASAVAPIVSGTGVLSGMAAGTAGITYTLPTGCNTTTVVTVISAPTSVITPVGSTSICPGDFVALTSGVVAGASYEWYNGGTLIPGAASSTYLAGASGSYQVRITLSAGCSALSSAVMVSVTPAVAAITVPGGVTTACEGTPITLNATPGAGLTYQWELAGTAIPGATAGTYNATTGGNYTVRVTNSTGCSATSAPVVITSIPVPSGVVSTSGPLAICAGNSVTLTAASGTSYFYQWHNAGGPIPGATTSAYTTNTAGNYHVVITGLSGCTTTTAPSAVVVNPRPTAAITASGPRVFCTGGMVTLNAPAGFSYQWYRNGIAIPGANSVNYLATLGGGYRVRVINTTTGCADTTHADTVVSVISSPSIVPLTAIKFCAGGSSLLSTSVSSLGSAISYQWSLNGTPLTGATGPTYNATVPGIYVCTISVPSSCVVSTAPVTVTQVALPTPPITYSGGVLSTSSGYATYQWYKDLAVIPGATSYSYTPTVIASYQVRVADANGCESASSAYLVNTVSAPMVENVNSAAVRIFPNPAQSVVHVESSLATRVSVSSVDGRMLVDLQNAKDIDISRLADGVYLISVFSADNQLLKTERLVKRSE